MSDNLSFFQKSSPFQKFLLLIGLYFLSLSFSQLGLALIYKGMGFDMNNASMLTAASLQANPTHVTMLKWMQIISALFSFLMPALLFSKAQTEDWFSFIQTKLPRKSWSLLLAIPVLVSLYPLILRIGKWNEGLHFGAADKILRDMEAQAAMLTEVFLDVHSIAGLIGNIIIVGLIAALTEEFFFRGTLQRVLQLWLKNPHIAIWTTAILFSFLHMQFLGFFPRMLMGAVLGYTYYWTKSIWPSVIMHFVNNSTQVIDYYISKNSQQKQWFDDHANTSTTMLISWTIVAGLLIYGIYRNGEVIKN